MSICLFILHFPPGSTVDLLLKVVDIEKLSYKCASLVKIGANYVELILALEVMGRKPTFFMVMGRKQPICWSQVDLSGLVTMPRSRQVPPCSYAVNLWQVESLRLPLARHDDSASGVVEVYLVVLQKLRETQPLGLA